LKCSEDWVQLFSLTFKVNIINTVDKHLKAMSKKNEKSLSKRLLSPPGDTIQETLDEIWMNKEQLAKRMSISRRIINEIIKGSAPITPEIAIQLEHVLGIPASFWIERERHYREELQRLEMTE
jgi:addiction module HigA family antidote